MSVLRIENLSKHFGGVAAVSGVTLTVERGRVEAVVGPNGAGKTTLFNLIAGIISPSGGRILLEDHDITPLGVAQRARLGLGRTFQNLQIFMNMTAVENVMVGRHCHSRTSFLAALDRTPSVAASNRDSRDRALALIDRVGFGAWCNADASAIPYGALKRLEIARALAAEPKLLLLDEPAAGLNPSESAEIANLIRSIAAEGVTVVLVEHDMKLVMNLAEWVTVFDYGRKLAAGAPEEIRRNPLVIEAYLGNSMQAAGGRGV